MSQKLHPTIAAAADRLTTTKTSVGTYVLTILKIVIPLLGPALGELLRKPGAAKYTKYLIEARDVLVAADLGDS